MEIIATNIGERKEIDWKGKKVTTGIFKYPTKRAIFLNTEKVKGDAICNREHHGGIDKAVYGYSFKHYDYWKKLYSNLEWNFGMFGENLTITDLDESKVYVGDIYKVGEVILEATKPRQPCMKLGVRFNNMKIVKQFWKQDFSGIYFKVLKKGEVRAGDKLQLIKKSADNPTIAEVYRNKRIEKGFLI